MSVTLTPVAFEGPLLTTVRVYVSKFPMSMGSRSSVLKIARSAAGVRVSTSEAESLPGIVSTKPAGGMTVAVLVRKPVAAGSMMPLRVRIALWPARSGEAKIHMPVPPL
jgi:hypothetical protein